jgi:hypothetical protein
MIPYLIGFWRPRTGGHAEKMLQGIRGCLLQPLASWHCLASCLEIVTALTLSPLSNLGVCGGVSSEVVGAGGKVQ